MKSHSYPNVSSYKDYRQLLTDFYEYRRSLQKGFSFRQLNQKAGFKSPNYLQRVIKGEKNLSEDKGSKIAEVLGMSSWEAECFLALIQKENADSPKKRTEADRRFLDAAEGLATQMMSTAQEEVFTRWHHLAVRETLVFQDFDPTGEAISQKLGGIVSPEQAAESLATLEKAGFIEKEGQNYKITEPNLQTDATGSNHRMIQKLHSENLKVWSENLTTLNADDQELQLLNIPISQDKIPLLQKKIQDFTEEIIRVAQDGAHPDCFVQVGSYLISFRK